MQRQRYHRQRFHHHHRIWLATLILLAALLLSGCSDDEPPGHSPNAPASPNHSQPDVSYDPDTSPQIDAHHEPEEPDCPACWDLSRAVYSEQFLDASQVTQNSRAAEFHPDGTRLYLVGRETFNIAEFHLDPPWDLSSADFITELSLAPEFIFFAHGLYLRKTDGQRLWLFNRTELYEYTLSTPWDVSSAESTGHLDLDAIVERGHDIDFSPDGSRLFIDDRDGQAVFEFHLPTPWEISDAALADTLDISEVEEQVRGIEFHPDGSRFFLVDTSRKEVLEFSVVEPWQLTGAALTTTFDLSAQSQDPRGITFKPDGSAFFITDATDARLLRYDLH